jgi:hypothetical protein
MPLRYPRGNESSSTMAASLVSLVTTLWWSSRLAAFSSIDDVVAVAVRVGADGAVRAEAADVVAARRARGAGLSVQRTAETAVVGRGRRTTVVRRRRRRRPAGADVRPGRRHADVSAAAVAVDGARLAGCPADRTGVGHTGASKRAGRVGHAPGAVATVGRRRASITRVAASAAETITARHAERVELADAGISRCRAAVVARRGDAARVVLVMANVALWVAAHRVAADADGITGRYLTDDIALAG